jgi:hypothetical protein
MKVPGLLNFLSLSAVVLRDCVDSEISPSSTLKTNSEAKQKINVFESKTNRKAYFCILG